MSKFVVLVFCLAAVGCSSPKKVSRFDTDQYCNTSSETILENDTKSSSRVTVRCSDDAVEKYVPAKMGIAKDCQKIKIPVNRKGYLVYDEIITCKKFDGSIDVIDPVWLR
jgi:hypothetical protein